MKRLSVTLSALLFVGLLSWTVHGQDEAPPVVWELREGVQSPESAYFDRGSGAVFVSQIGEGGPTGKNGDGYISRLTPEGEVISQKWATGLNAPKGLRSHESKLWVSDIDRLIGIDIDTGNIFARVPVPESVFLNDVACDGEGTVYVSDMLGNKIYRYRQGRVDVFAEGDKLEYPNGLLVEGGRLVVASWGKPKEDFSTDTPGRLYTLDLETGEKALITPKPLGNLDGLESVAEGRYLVSDWNAGKLIYVTSEGRAISFLQLPKGAADIGYVPGKLLLIVPQMLEGKVTAYQLEAPKEAR